jgi:hypothetical protein
MGYELNKLMERYGVSTPGVVAYTGPTAPIVPTAPAALGKSPTDAQTTAYNKAKKAYENYTKDPSAFNELMRRYGLAQKEYDQYSTDYLSRISGTPMYGEAQYQTGLESAPKAVTYSDMVAAPTYGNVPVTFAGKPQQELFDYYDRLRKIGYTDADLRAATEKSFGKMTDTMWNPYLSQLDSTVDTSEPDSTVDTSEPDSTVDVTKPGAAVDVPKSGSAALSGPFLEKIPTVSLPSANIPAVDTLTFNKQPVVEIPKMDPNKFVGPILEEIPVKKQPIINLPVVDYLTPGTKVYSHGGVHSMAKKYNVGGVARYFKKGGSKGQDKGEDDFENASTSEMLDMIEEIIRERGSAFEGTPAAEAAPEPAAPSTNWPTIWPRQAVVDNPALAAEPSAAPPAAPPAEPPAVRSATQVAAPPAEPPAAAKQESPATKPLTLSSVVETPVSPAAAQLMDMLGKYEPTESIYEPELKKASRRLAAESAAFTDLLQKAMKSEDVKPDKSEMYFRLAAAFGSPTKTGTFAENLGMAGKELAEYARDVRTAKKADRALQMQLGLEAQKARMQAAREELTSLRSLAGQERSERRALTVEDMKDRRAIIMEYIKSGRPQSEAGKAAIDAGLKQGTPEFTAFVNKYIDDKVRSGNLLKEAMVAIAGGQLNVAQQRADIAKQAEQRQGKAEQRQQEAAGKLTPKEVDLKVQAEASITTIDNAMRDLNRAFVLNKDSFDSSLKDRATLAILEQTGSKDPKVLNTKELLNLLKSAMISSASEKLKGVLSDSDIKLLQSVAGLDAASREERASIMKNAYRALQAGRAAQQKRLEEITQGLYRETTPGPATAGEGE